MIELWATLFTNTAEGRIEGAALVAKITHGIPQASELAEVDGTAASPAVLVA